VDLDSGPDPTAPVDVCLHQSFYGVSALAFKNAKHAAQVAGGAQGHQGAMQLKSTAVASLMNLPLAWR